MKTMMFAAALLIPFAGSGGVRAAELEPMQGLQKNFRSGASALVYFTDEADGYHVVTTLQCDDTETAKVFRFTSVLAPGERSEISVPHALGEPADAIVISRVGNRLMVDDAAKVSIVSSAR
jgi:hypothetical protein